MDTYYNVLNNTIPISSNNWLTWYLKGCYWVASKSKDLCTHVGAILTQSNRIISTGYNGIPSGMDDTKDDRQNYPYPICIDKNKTKNIYTVHAEQNAIFSAAKMGASTNKSTLYVNIFPCPDCVRAIIQSGINVVVYHKYFTDIITKTNNQIHTKYNQSRNWIKSWSTSTQMLTEANVSIIEYSQKINCVGFYEGKHWNV